ncbi:hypothetical protein Pmar_PMAR003275, partial [Perkinsus marinus ATCC 50983]
FEKSDAFFCHLLCKAERALLPEAVSGYDYHCFCEGRAKFGESGQKTYCQHMLIVIRDDRANGYSSFSLLCGFELVIFGSLEVEPHRIRGGHAGRPPCRVGETTTE